MKLLNAQLSEAEIRALLPEVPERAELAVATFDYREHTLRLVFRQKVDLVDDGTTFEVLG